MSCGVIIINWNNAEGTIRCVKEVASWDQINPVIFVVDNASTDGSAELIQQECPHVELIKNPNNAGFAGANNRAIEKILAQHLDTVLMLNNDATIEEKHVQSLINVLSDNTSIGAVGPLLEEGDVDHKKTYCGGRNIAFFVKTRRAVGKKWVAKQLNKGPFYPTNYIPGTALLVRASTLQEVDMLDEEYFFSGEIADYCRRIKKQGQQCVINLQAKANHHIDASSSVRQSLYLYYSLRNRFLYVKKHYPAAKYILRPYWVAAGLFMAFWAVISHRPLKLRGIYWAIYDGCFGKYGNRHFRFITPNQEDA